MKKNSRWWSGMGTSAGLALFFSGAAAARGAQYGGQAQTPPPQQGDKPKTPDVAPLTLDAAAPPVNADEDAAYKAFQEVSPDAVDKKIEAGEAFLQKFPQSRYLPPIYSGLTIAYYRTKKVQKMLDVGDKAVELTPTDVTTLALLAQTISRVTGSTTPNAGKQLEKAENYAKRAIEVTPTLPKPTNLTDEAFTAAKNQTLAAAHSGLGLVDVKRGKNEEAIPELETSIKLDPSPDPVNYYLLGMANVKTSHFEDAVSAFAKCATIASSMQAMQAMQATCKTQGDEAKKLGATELSAPK